MSVFGNDFVINSAESIGVPELADDVAAALTQDMEYRLREVIQEAKKYMRHSHRSFLTASDVSCALKAKNIEPLYGYVGPRPLGFRKVPEQDLFYLEDDVLDFDKLINTPLPPLPHPVSVSAHWLAIDGVQPLIPQNPIIALQTAGNASKKRKQNTGLAAPTIQPGSAPLNALSDAASRGNYQGSINVFSNFSAAESVSRELQLYYDRITEAVLSDDHSLRAVALGSIATDPGLQALLPYFVRFAQDGVNGCLRNILKLSRIVDFFTGLLSNENFFHEPYLHQVIPVLLTTVVCRQLGSDDDQNNSDDATTHWKVRVNGAKILTTTVTKFSDSYPSLLPRVTKTLLIALLDEKKPPATKFGAVVALSLLGPAVVRASLITHAKTYAQCFDQINYSDPSHHNTIKLREAYVLALAKYHASCAKHSFPSSVSLFSSTQDSSVANEMNPAAHSEQGIVQAYGESLGKDVFKLMIMISEGKDGFIF